MKTYKGFIDANAIEEETLAFTYKDGGQDQTILISGSSSQLKKVKKKLPGGTKVVDNVPKGAMEISASDWLKIN